MSDDLLKRLSRIGERVSIPCPDNIRGCLVFHYRVDTDPACVEAIDEIERLRAENEQLLNGYDQILGHLSDAVQSDCENGVRVLNEIAAKNYLKEYPETRAAFHAIGKIARAALEGKDEK